MDLVCSCRLSGALQSFLSTFVAHGSKVCNHYNNNSRYQECEYGCSNLLVKFYVSFHHHLDCYIEKNNTRLMQNEPALDHVLYMLGFMTDTTRRRRGRVTIKDRRWLVGFEVVSIDDNWSSVASKEL